MGTAEIQIKRDGGYEYVDLGTGKVLVLLHGLFGALSNWKSALMTFSQEYRVLIPLMPIYKQTGVEASVGGLARYVGEFLDYKRIDKCTVLGNSLGGHIALVFALQHPEKMEGLVLTGSSGLYESGMGSTFPKRGDKKYITERVGFTFYDPDFANEELINEVFGIVNDNYKALRILKIARAAQRHNMRQDITKIEAPSLLVWGLNDNITPPNVAHEFHKLLPNSELSFIDRCGHAAMMEKPQEFNQRVEQFLKKVYF